MHHLVAGLQVVPNRRAGRDFVVGGEAHRIAQSGELRVTSVAYSSVF